MDREYIKIIKKILKQKNFNNTKELLNYQFTINPERNITYIRNPSIKYILAENIWYFYGSQDVKWIGRFANMWNDITDDHVTSNSAYGHIIKYRHGFDQLDKIIELLKIDPSSRRALININVPNINVIKTKDEMCTIALQFYIRNNKLCATVMMRSNDIWFGLPYDVIFFTELQKYIARKLNIKLGNYTHFVTSLHLYTKDENKIKELLKNNKVLNRKKYKINFINLIDQVEELYKIVTKENIIKICLERGILYEN